VSAVQVECGPALRGAAELVVDLAAVAENTRLIARRATGEVMAVVKADGFGHGAAALARTALENGATRLGVTSIDEALPLREAGLTAPVLSWLNAVDADFAAAVAADVELAVPTRSHLEAIIRRAPGARVHLHLDTGMARDGAAPYEWAGLCRAARRAERQGLLRVVGVMGHLGSADQPRDAANDIGRMRFAWVSRWLAASGCAPRSGTWPPPPPPSRTRGATTR
jgi:alanine racemase